MTKTKVRVNERVERRAPTFITRDTERNVFEDILSIGQILAQRKTLHKYVYSREKGTNISITTASGKYQAT